MKICILKKSLNLPHDNIVNIPGGHGIEINVHLIFLEYSSDLRNYHVTDQPWYNSNLFVSRAEYGEKTVQKLNLRVDNIMFDLVQEKTKTQNVNEELDQTFNLFVAH